MENLRDFANRFTHTHEGENVLRAYRVMFPEQFEEAVSNTVILERALGDQEPALEALTKVGEIEFLLEETTIQNLTFDDIAKKRSLIYRKINDKADQIKKFWNSKWLNPNLRNILMTRGYTLEEAVTVLV